jgi:hypothetical protein
LALHGTFLELEAEMKFPSIIIYINVGIRTTWYNVQYIHTYITLSVSTRKKGRK